MSTQKKPSVYKNFLIGGSSGMFATCCIQPIDFVKVQLQIKAEGHKGIKLSPYAVAKETLSKYGILRFYTGLDSALLRQATYTTTRLGLYKTFMDWGNKEYKNSVPIWLKGLFSIAAGGLGSIVGNPADLALIRMQSDHTLPIEKRRNYTGVFNALARIFKEEGPLALWKGATPTVIRAMALNFGMLGPYDQAKETLSKVFGTFKGIGITSSAIAAFFACLFSLPFDNVKTKFQKMIKEPDGQYPYRSFLDCFSKSLKNEGLIGLYAGFPTFVFRIAPHIVITLLATDYLNSQFN
jgi:solute carrier family 25 (mitochondrial oxoglutarate transporter), member 11